jgi:hypothetical protein
VRARQIFDNWNLTSDHTKKIIEISAQARQG